MEKVWNNRLRSTLKLTNEWRVVNSPHNYKKKIVLSKAPLVYKWASWLGLVDNEEALKFCVATNNWWLTKEKSKNFNDTGKSSL